METRRENYFVWLFKQLKGWPIQNYCLWFFAFGFQLALLIQEKISGWFKEYIVYCLICKVISNE